MLWEGQAALTRLVELVPQFLEVALIILGCVVQHPLHMLRSFHTDVFSCCRLFTLPSFHAAVCVHRVSITLRFKQQLVDVVLVRTRRRGKHGSDKGDTEDAKFAQVGQKCAPAAHTLPCYSVFLCHSVGECTQMCCVLLCTAVFCCVFLCVLTSPLPLPLGTHEKKGVPTCTTRLSVPMWNVSAFCICCIHCPTPAVHPHHSTTI